MQKTPNPANTMLDSHRKETSTQNLADLDDCSDNAGGHITGSGYEQAQHNVCSCDQEKDVVVTTRVERDGMDMLQTILLDLGLPETIDRTDRPRGHMSDDVTIVIISVEAEAWSVFFEGNRQYPGSVLYALTPFWVTRRPSPKDVSMDTLFVHKAVTADGGGQTYLDAFSPPRRVTYVINHVLGGGGGAGPDDVIQQRGAALTSFGLDVPMNSSLALSRLVNDTLWTRGVAEAVELAHPVTLGFWLPGESGTDYPNSFPSIRVVRLPSRHVSAQDVEPCVREFLESEQMRKYEKVVVKAFGPLRHGSEAVSFHLVSEVEAIVAAVLDLTSHIQPGHGVLVESFHTTFDPIVTFGSGNHAINIEGKQLACRLRVIVSRTPVDGARTSSIVCGINYIDVPVHARNSVPVSLELMLHKWGIRDVRQQKLVRDVIRRDCEKLLQRLTDREKDLTPEERGGVGASLDMIGLDVILTKSNDVIIPVIIGVRGQDCLGPSFTYETMNPERRWQATRVWVRTMLSRSQRYLMEGKVVLVVGGGLCVERTFWNDARDFGVKIVLVDSNPDHLAKDQVHRFLHVLYDDHTRDHEHADVIVRRVRSEVGNVHGCLPCWEDCVPLTSLVAEGLGLAFTPPYQAAFAAKSKRLTQRVLLNDQSRTPQAMTVSIYASRVASVSGVDDLPEAVRKVHLPAVLKFEFGSGGTGTRHVTTYSETEEHVQKIPRTLDPDDGLGHGDTMVLMPRLLGTEHDVEVVMRDGHVTAAFVVDMGPTRRPLCAQRVAVLPSVLPEENRRQLISASASCCRSLGLMTGVFCVGMMLTPCGPRLLEVNARMGGQYTRDFILHVHHVDLLLLALLAACGLRPVPGDVGLGDDDEEEVMVGINLFHSCHGHALATDSSPGRLRRLHEEGALTFVQHEDRLRAWSHEYEEPFATLAVRAPTLLEARAKLVSTCMTLGLETEETLGEILQDAVCP